MRSAASPEVHRDSRTSTCGSPFPLIAAHGLCVHGFCLMSNHIHLVATPTGPLSSAKAVGRTDYLYTRTINRLHGRSGHLWQNRFYSVPLDEPHFWTALAYVEQNPVRAGMVRQAWTYAWSSERTTKPSKPCGGARATAGRWTATVSSLNSRRHWAGGSGRCRSAGPERRKRLNANSARSAHPVRGSHAYEEYATLQTRPQMDSGANNGDCREFRVLRTAGLLITTRYG